MYYTLFDVLIDTVLLAGWGGEKPPNQLPASLPEQTVRQGIDKVLEELKYDQNVPALTALEKLSPKLDNYRKFIGQKHWQTMKAEVTRVCDTVREVGKGLSPAELQLLQESEGAKGLLADYLLLANHVAAKDDAALASTVNEALPKLKENLQNFARGHGDHGTLHGLIDHIASNEAHADQLMNAARQSRFPRMVTQAASVGFSSWPNFKTTLGSAVKFEHSTASMLFYGGLVGLAHSAYDVFRPETKEETNGTRPHGWRMTVLESTASIAAVLGGLVMAGRRISLTK